MEDKIDIDDLLIHTTEYSKQEHPNLTNRLLEKIRERQREEILDDIIGHVSHD